MTQAPATRMTYKPEIDGLRAVAVLLVLLTHMQLGITGGFIGVDIFFVISGYLITAILLQSMAEKKFGFWDFYGRRFVRLYPALLVTVVLTFVLGFLLLDPVALSNLARTGKYVLGSVSNLFYYEHQGYFDVAAKKQVFLHTWSLGVEWQFYLLWPLLLWLIFKIPFKGVEKGAGAPKNHRRFIVCLLLVIITLSVIASEWAVTHQKNMAAYYHMPYRAFELGIGALLVFAYNIKIKPAVGAALTLVGLAAILYFSFTLSGASAFPGVRALGVCLAAAACMLGSKAFSRGNMLRLSPVVFYGKASYSIYLVHWPLLIFYSYYVYRPLLLAEKVSLLIAASLLGILMYLAVEKRVNWRRFVQVKHGALMGCMAMLVMVAGIAPVFHYISKKGDGLRWRLDAVQLEDLNYYEPGYAKYKDFVMLGAPNSKPMAVVAGDSFAHSYATGMDEYLQRTQKAIDMRTEPGCVVSDLYIRSDLNEKSKAACRNVYTAATQSAKENNLPLVLIQSWDNYKIHRFTNWQTGSVLNFTQQAIYDAFVLENLNAIWAQMAGRKLILVGTVPYHMVEQNEKECLARPSYLPNTLCQQQLGMTYNASDSVVSHINGVIEQFAAQHDNVFYIDPSSIACLNGICTAKNNAMIYNDGSHFSKYGSRLVAPYVVDEIERIISAP